MRITKDILDGIIKDYNKGNGLNVADLKNKYNVSEYTIRKKLKEANVFNPKTHQFTNDDIEFLRENYPKGDWNVIMKHFNNSTKQSIMSIASKYGIKMINEHAWSEDELNIIRKYYADNIKLVQELLPNRSYKAILAKAKRLNIKSREFWSLKDNELLTKYYPILPIDDIVKIFPNRSRNSIIKHAVQLNVQSYDYHPWTSEEDVYIKNNYQIESDNIMCKKLGRTYKAT